MQRNKRGHIALVSGVKRFDVFFPDNFTDEDFIFGPENERFSLLPEKHVGDKARYCGASLIVVGTVFLVFLFNRR